MAGVAVGGDQRTSRSCLGKSIHRHTTTHTTQENKAQHTHTHTHARTHLLSDLRIHSHKHKQSAPVARTGGGGGGGSSGRRPKDISQLSGEELKRVNKLARFVQSALQVCVVYGRSVCLCVGVVQGGEFYYWKGGMGVWSCVCVYDVVRACACASVCASESLAGSCAGNASTHTNTRTHAHAHTQYDDVANAVKNLEEALDILTY